MATYQYHLGKWTLFLSLILVQSVFSNCRERMGGFAAHPPLETRTRQIARFIRRAIAGYLLYQGTSWGYTYYELSHLDESKLAEYESQNYDGKSVINEMVKSWVESLDYEPTKREIEEQRTTLEEQEQRGIFRIYATEP